MDFALIQEGLALVSRLEEGSDTFMADLARLRDIIGAAPPEDKPVMEIDVSSKKAAEDGFLRYLQDFEKIPEHLRGVEYSMALTIVGGRVLSNGLSKEQKNAILPIPDRYGEKAVEIYKSFKEKGFTISDEEKSDIISVDAAIKALRNYRSEDSDDVKKLKAERDLLHSKLIKTDINTPESKKIYEEYDAAAEKVYSAIDKLNEKRNKGISEEMAIINKIGGKLIDGLLEKSTITEKQSLDWAEKQEITPAAVAKLKRNGYSKEQLIKDMADFYRITGGKAYSFILDADRSKRSYAKGGSSNAGDERNIAIGSGFNRKILWHEMAHHIEGDKVAFYAASGFIASRRKSEKPEKLRKLVPGSDYEADEVAFPDEFINAYIGKYYPQEATEVFSMGLQYLSDPYDAAMFASKDPDMLAFITGYLSSPITVAAKAKLTAHEVISTKNAESFGELKSAYPIAVKKLASVMTHKDESTHSGGDETVEMLIRYGYKYSGYIESPGGAKFYIFSEVKVRNHITGRKAKGFYFVDESELGSYREFAGDKEELIAMLGMRYVTGTNDAYMEFRKKKDAAVMKKIIDASELVK